MTNVPSTIIIKLLDQVNFPMEQALVVFPEMFSFGVKEICSKGERIYICLKYTPKHKNLQKKFGNLPIQYLRTKMVNKDKDLKLFEMAMRKYTFQLRVDDDEEEEERRQQKQPKQIPSTAGPSPKRVKLSHPSPPSPPPPTELISSEEDEDTDIIQETPVNKKKKLTPLKFDKVNTSPYVMCVTPEYIGDGLWTPGKLTDISANVVSYQITRKIDIDTLDLPESCKILIHRQFYKNHFGCEFD